jgi:hypothetical protein
MDGRVLVQLPEAQVNGVPLPASARGDLERQAQHELDQRVGVYHIQSIRIAESSLTVSRTRQ